MVNGVDPERISGLKARLQERFIIDDKKTPEELAKAAEDAEEGAIGVWAPDAHLCALARPKVRGAELIDGLSVSVLQEEIIKGMLGYTQEMIDSKQGLEYVKGVEAAVSAMATGDYQACFFVRPTSAHDIMAVAQSGRKLPQKSTYFFPKIWSGTLLYMH
jgi:uncharacterized protein (DUF1015 family)